MNAGIGAGYTHADHPALASQLFSCYARSQRVRLLASVMGEDSLPEIDRGFLRFGREFEERLVRQDGPRTLEESMAIGWRLLRELPHSELTRLTRQQIQQNLQP
jgi:V/A-type H+-transporting ATPase subunit B